MQVSNYFVLQDVNFEIDENSMKRFTVKMPTASQFVKATARPILMFNMDPRTGHHLKFIVVLNHPGTEVGGNIPNEKIVWAYDKPDDIMLLRSTHEVLDGNKFLPGADNTIDFVGVMGGFASRVWCCSFASRPNTCEKNGVGPAISHAGPIGSP